MGFGRRTYSDTTDSLVVNTTVELLRTRREFVTQTFAALCQDPSFSRGVLLNVGAGRRIVDDEVAFFGQFETVLLLEPDEARRAALAQDPAAQGATLLSDPIQELDPAALPPADFVLCKYVLQHLPTADVEAAVAGLKDACAPGGAVGIFSSSSPDQPFYVLSAPPEVRGQLPVGLQPDSRQRISRAQFDALIADPPPLDCIPTHHLSRSALTGLFADWDDVHMEVSAFGAVYVQARRPLTG